MQLPAYDERSYIAAEQYFEDHASDYEAEDSPLLKETIMAIFTDGWNACMKVKDDVF